MQYNTMRYMFICLYANQWLLNAFFRIHLFNRDTNE